MPEVSNKEADVDVAEPRSFIAHIRLLARRCLTCIWGGRRLVNWSRLVDRTINIGKHVPGFVWSLTWLSVGTLVAILLAQGLARRTITIETLRVPKTIEERGFTGGVAAERLRDAISKFIGDIGTYMPSRFQLPSDRPDIIVPSIGLSLDSIVSATRTFFRSDYRRNLSGDLTIRGSKLWLRLRLNGNEFYNSPKGADPDDLDQLFYDAAPAILQKTQPYILVVKLSRTNANEALKLAKEMTDSPTLDDTENVKWALNLERGIYLRRHQYVDGIDAIKKAIELDPNFAIAHETFGTLLLATENRGEAQKQYREAITLEPKFAGPHAKLANLLRLIGRLDESAKEFQQALGLNPDADAHYDYGLLLRQMENENDAEREFQSAVNIAPKTTGDHVVRGLALQQFSRFDEAADEYQYAINADPSYVAAHYDLALTSEATGNKKKAIAEYQTVLQIDPDNVNARERLNTLQHPN
jgi:tetratricopeptide (TPR) repeat protein